MAVSRSWVRSVVCMAALAAPSLRGRSLSAKKGIRLRRKCRAEAEQTSVRVDDDAERGRNLVTDELAHALVQHLVVHPVVSAVEADRLEIGRQVVQRERAARKIQGQLGMASNE